MVAWLNAAACGTSGRCRCLARTQKAAVDASGRVGGLGDDDPSVAATIGGPPRSNAKKVGGQPAPPVIIVGVDALVARPRTAPDDA